MLFVVITSSILIFSPLKALSQRESIETIAEVPMPKLKKPVYILGPAGEIFNFATCNAGNLGFTIAAADIPAGAGPLPHIHHYTNEWFWTPKGGIEIFHSAQEFPDLKKPATIDANGRTEVYTIDMKSNQIVHGPKFYVHGFVNTTNETAPLTFIWMQDQISPKYPMNDGGIREYFEEVGIKINDLKALPEITDQARKAFVTQGPKYGINQSYYFLQYVNHVSNKVPSKILNLRDDKSLNRILNHLAL